MVHSVSIGRLIRAPIAVVFDAWTDPRVMERWLKPREDVVTSVESDPKVGAPIRIVMHANQRDEVHDGVFRLIDPPNRLSFTWTSAPAGADTLVHVSFLTSSNEHTMLLLKHSGLASRAAEQNHREGWRRILDRLAETLEPRPRR